VLSAQRRARYCEVEVVWVVAGCGFDDDREGEAHGRQISDPGGKRAYFGGDFGWAAAGLIKMIRYSID
jgi:hypothetical protein